MEYDREYTLEMSVRQSTDINPKDYFSEEEWEEMSEDEQSSFLTLEAWEQLEQNIQIKILDD